MKNVLISIVVILLISIGIFVTVWFTIDKSENVESGEDCNRRESEYGFVCVCNETMCGNIGKVAVPKVGYYTLISSSKEDKRFDVTTNQISVKSNTKFDSVITINSSNHRQHIIGFGGAFTDAMGIVVSSLSENLQRSFISSYFSPNGIEYNIARIPIAGSDFSVRVYSYDDFEGDIKLENFTLAEEDYRYKIPYIKNAISLSEKNINLYASPWAPPIWMKTNGKAKGFGKLIPEMRQPWANYFVKFLDSYQKEGIYMWGITAQNEPSVGLLIPGFWNSCGFTAEEQNDFVKNYLGPTLTEAGYLPKLKLMVSDDSRYILPSYPLKILSDPDSNKYISGVGVHWYLDDVYSPSVLDKVHDEFPDKFILYSEACSGFELLKKAVMLGSWKRGEDYASDIIENLNHWASGWTDWNMALDMKGGPNWASNFVDAPIIINQENNEFLKQPMFYAMGHFSKFIPEGSIVLETKVESQNKTIEAVSVLNPEGRKVLVVLNKDTSPATILIKDIEESILSLEIASNSFHTILLN